MDIERTLLDLEASIIDSPTSALAPLGQRHLEVLSSVLSIPVPSTGIALAGCVAAGMATVGPEGITHALHDITNTTLFALGVPFPQRVMANWRLAVAPAILGLAYGGGGSA